MRAMSSVYLSTPYLVESKKVPASGCNVTVGLKLDDQRLPSNDIKYNTATIFGINCMLSMQVVSHHAGKQFTSMVAIVRYCYLDVFHLSCA